LMQAIVDYWRVEGHDLLIHSIKERLVKMNIASKLLVNESCDKCGIIWEKLVENKIDLPEALYASVIILHDETVIEEILELFKEEHGKLLDKVKFIDFIVLDCFVNAYELMFDLIEKCNQRITINTHHETEVVEWPPSDTHLLELFNQSLGSIDFVQVKIKHSIEQKIKEYINNEEKPLVARTNISQIASKHIKLDEKLLAGFYITQIVKEVWKDGSLLSLPTNTELFATQIQHLITISNQASEFSALMEIMRLTKSNFMSSVVNRLISVEMWSFLYEVLHCDRGLLNDEKVESIVFAGLLNHNMINEAHWISFTSKNLRNLGLEHYKEHFEHRMSQEVMIELIRCGFVEHVVKYESFLEVLFDEPTCILGSESGDAECQLICDLVIGDHLEIALGYIGLKVFCVPEIYLGSNCKMIMLKDYLKNQIEFFGSDGSDRIIHCKKLSTDALNIVMKK
jgi:hypothetical protein